MSASFKSTDLRNAAADLRKQAEEAKTAHVIKCAQVLAGAKGLSALQEMLNKVAETPGATSREL